MVGDGAFMRVYESHGHLLIELEASFHHQVITCLHFNMLSRTAVQHQRHLLPLSSRLYVQPQIRAVSNAALRTSLKPTQASVVDEPSPLSKMPMGVLLRSVALTTVMANKWLLRPSLAFIALITQSNSVLLNPDKNPALSRILQWTIYDHFCAGNSIAEVSNTVKYIKDLGFHGIILGYSKDVVLDPNVELPTTGIEDYPAECYRMIDEWKKGNIETLNMIESGDLLAVK
jgi:proline dehydrogenase